MAEPAAPFNPAGTLRFWQRTGRFGRGHVTYAPGVLEQQGPFTNPARMVEDTSDPFYAGVWLCAGWWDKQHTCEPGYHDCMATTCEVCEELMVWVECPTGGWWKHVDHPADGHDGQAPVPTHVDGSPS